MSSRSYLAIAKIVIPLVLVSLLSACSALNTSIEKADLDVQTRASESIFLEYHFRLGTQYLGQRPGYQAAYNPAPARQWLPDHR